MLYLHGTKIVLSRILYLGQKLLIYFLGLPAEFYILSSEVYQGLLEL